MGNKSLPSRGCCCAFIVFVVAVVVVVRSSYAMTRVDVVPWSTAKIIAGGCAVVIFVCLICVELKRAEKNHIKYFHERSASYDVFSSSIFYHQSCELKLDVQISIFVHLGD